MTHPWRRAKRTAGELAFGAIDAVTGVRPARRAGWRANTRSPLDVLVIGVYRDGAPPGRRAARTSLERHNVRIALGAMGAADARLREQTVAEA